MRTLTHISHRHVFFRTLEITATDVCGVPEICIHDSSSTIRLASLSSPSLKFYVRPSWNPEAAACAFANARMALSEKAVAAQLDWILVDRQRFGQIK